MLFGLPIVFSATMLWLSLGLQEDMDALAVATEVQHETIEGSQNEPGLEEETELPQTNSVDEEAQKTIEAASFKFLKYAGIATGLFWILFPLWQKFYFRFVASNSLYGRERFNFIATATEFYAIYIIASLLFIGAVIVTSLLAGGMAALELGGITAISVLFGVLALAPFLFAQAYVQTQKTNVVYSNLELEDIAFSSELKVPMMAWLYISNTVAIILSLGLLVPWAKIRMARYRASTMTLYANNFDEFQARAAGDIGAGGSEISDFMDIDLGL